MKNPYVIAALIGLALVFAVITWTWIQAIRQQRDDAREDMRHER
jgi:hypothetical protein